VSGGLQVGHDGLDSALGQATALKSWIPGAGVAGDLYEHAQRGGSGAAARPAAAAFSAAVPVAAGGDADA
jgi:hypothetical protein